MFQQGPGRGDPGPQWGGPGATRCTNSPVTQNHTRRERVVSPASRPCPQAAGREPGSRRDKGRLYPGLWRLGRPSPPSAA